MVITRFPPSPTGFLHLGGARTALYSWLYAKKCQGKMVLRIEDTDIARSTKEAIDVILDGMQWLGLHWDEGPFYQTQRFERYQSVIQQMLDNKQAYRCVCSKERLNELRDEQMRKGLKPRYDGCCRDLEIGETKQDYVIRFKNPQEGVVHFVDHVRGSVSFHNQELDDVIIQRTDGVPTYNFCVVIDDIDMGISHIIRGEDHINNTPRQINIYRALGALVPQFAHVSMILGEDGAKLSKRHGAVNVLQYREDGYLPQALLNYLVRLGWSNGDQEIFSIDEMIQLFDLDNLNKSASAFNLDKLKWLNQYYLKNTSIELLMPHVMYHFEKQNIDVQHGPKIEDLMPIMAERVSTLVELVEQSRYFYCDIETYDEKASKKFLTQDAVLPLLTLLDDLKSLDIWDVEFLDALIKQTVHDLDIGFGKLGMPLRVVLTGSSQSPSLGHTLFLLGKEKSINRIENAIYPLERQYGNNNSEGRFQMGGF